MSDFGYPELQPCVDAIHPLISRWAKEGDTELEIRIGRAHGDRFVSQADASFMHDVISFMETNREKVRSTGWSEFHDFFYTNSKGEKIRTRVMYDEIDLKVKPRHIKIQNREH